MKGKVIKTDLEPMIVVANHPIFDPGFLRNVNTVIQNADKYVYHYTRWERLLDIANSGFRLGFLASMNDPRESKDWLLSVGTSRNVTSPDFKLIDKAVADYRARIRVGSFTKDNPYGDERNFGRRGYGHPRMWAQYAGNHTGVCIVFDREKLDEAIRKRYKVEQDSWVFDKEVKYIESVQEEPTNLVIRIEDDQDIDVAVRNYFVSAGHQIFFTKHIDWRDEQEFRWVHYTDAEQCDNEEPFADVRDAVVALVLGADFALAHLPVAQRFSEVYGLSGDVVQCRWERLHLQLTVFAERGGNWIPIPPARGRMHLSSGPVRLSPVDS